MMRVVTITWAGGRSLNLVGVNTMLSTPASYYVGDCKWLLKSFVGFCVDT
jgi:hypothetical protein